MEALTVGEGGLLGALFSYNGEAQNVWQTKSRCIAGGGKRGGKKKIDHNKLQKGPTSNKEGRFWEKTRSRI